MEEANKRLWQWSQQQYCSSTSADGRRWLQTELQLVAEHEQLRTPPRRGRSGRHLLQQSLVVGGVGMSPPRLVMASSKPQSSSSSQLPTCRRRALLSTSHVAADREPTRATSRSYVCTRAKRKRKCAMPLREDRRRATTVRVRRMHVRTYQTSSGRPYLMSSSFSFLSAPMQMVQSPASGLALQQNTISNNPAAKQALSSFSFPSFFSFFQRGRDGQLTSFSQTGSADQVRMSYSGVGLSAGGARKTEARVGRRNQEWSGGARQQRRSHGRVGVYINQEGGGGGGGASRDTASRRPVNCLERRSTPRGWVATWKHDGLD